MYILLTKEYPFWGESEYQTFKSILKEKLKFPKSIPLSKEIRHLINRMLDKNPSTRYSMEDVMIHPWFDRTFESPDKNKRFNESIADNHDDTYDDSAGNK